MALEVFKLNKRILLAVQISFVDSVVGQAIKDELRGEFASFEEDTFSSTNL
jgi:hypothetical protein